MKISLAELHRQGHLNLIALHAGRYIHAHVQGEDRKLIALAAALVSQGIADGHVCMPLQVIAEQINRLCPLEIESAVLAKALTQSQVVAEPDAFAPLVLDAEQNLYLHRLYRCEQTIARGIATRAAQSPGEAQVASADVLNALFPKTEQDTQPDLQKVAVARAVHNNLLVVSGGPGTGKTFTAARILAAIGAAADRPLRVCLAAPTGKAAARLKESMLQAKAHLGGGFQAYIPEETNTIHRLLGVIPRTGQYRYNSKNPLQIDLLMIDEASMIDVPLMSSLLEALPSHCRLIILGDKNQLASVEAGNLFADLCSQSDRSTPAGSEDHLQHVVVELTRTYRFSTHSGISRLAASVLKGDIHEADACLQQATGDIAFLPASSVMEEEGFNDFIHRYFTVLFSCAHPQEALELLDHARILCAVQKGARGVEDCNNQAVRYLAEQGMTTSMDKPFHGMPILIRKNEYTLNIFNGDTGLVWKNKQGALEAWFKGPDNVYLNYPLQQVPTYQRAYAMTVHKSQGSEYDHVLLYLPTNHSSVLSKEMLYTGITRAKKHLTISGTRQMFKQGMQRSVHRYSGLGKALERITHQLR